MGVPMSTFSQLASNCDCDDVYTVSGEQTSQLHTQ